MTRRAKDALIGVGYIVVIAALIALSLAIYNHSFTHYVTVSAHVPVSADAMQDGAPVMVRGIQIGEVDAISTDGKNVDLQLKLTPDRTHDLPSNITVQLLPQTLFGQSYVNFVLPARASGQLSSGDTLEQDSSPGTVALEHVFTSLQRTLTIVQPEKLSATLGEIAIALRGKGQDLADTLGVIGRYLHHLQPQVPQLADDLNRLSDVANTYTDAAPDLLRGLAAFTHTSKLLVAQRADYVDLLASLTRTGQVVGRFVGTSRNQIIGLAAVSRPTLELTRRYAGEFPCLSNALVDLIPRVNKAFGVGTGRPGARVLLHVAKPSSPYTSTAGGFHSDREPHCPYVPATALANTALTGSGLPGTSNAKSAAATNAAGAKSTDAKSTGTKSTGVTSTAAESTGRPDGMGSVNSPAENELIAELMAPQAGLAPSAYPKWGSLLVGPALRGAQVSVK